MRYASVSIVLASVVVACNSDGRYLAEENAQQALSVSITISGRLTTGTGLPIAGNRVVLAGAKSTSVLSDAAGGYQFAGLPPGSYSVRPDPGACQFVPDVVNPVPNRCHRH